MRFQVGVGLAAGMLLCFVALSASATGSGGGGNAWGTHLSELKSMAGTSLVNGHGHAWGLLLADIKGKGARGEHADDRGEDEGGAHVITSVHVGKDELGSVGPGRHTEQGEDDQGEDEGNGGTPTPPGGGVGSGVGSPPVSSPPHDVAAVPEPSAALLFAAGTGLVVVAQRRR